MQTPIDRFKPSPRRFQDQNPPFNYGPDDLPRRVHDGRIHFNGRRLRVPKAFNGKTIALRPTHQDGLYQLVFRTSLITSIDLAKPVEHHQPVTDVSAHPSPMSPV